MTNLTKSFWLFVLLALAGINRAAAQLASFSFGGPSIVTSWTNLSGDPYSAVQTATAGGITVSSISPANWAPNGVPSCEYNYGGASPGVYFPDAVMVNSWLQYNGSGYNLALYNAAVPQLLLSGLNKDSTYILRMSGNDKYYTGNTQYTVAGAGLAGSQQLNTYNNTTQGVTFTHVQPDSNGTIRIWVNATSSALFAFISGLQVFPGSANVGVPVIALTAPANGIVQSEGGNFILSAMASETGGTISKVEFFADTTKIGEVDATPYTMTWVDPDPGSYQITAKATDAIGTIATASANVGVQSLNYFWSTTGNSATGGDTSFVGTVDSNRLAFRTKDLERMTISAIGNVGIGTDSPTAQLHTTGSVRMAGLGNDSNNVQPRMLVSDSSGRLFYRNLPSGSLNAGQGLGQAAGGIALGDTIAGTGPHSFGSNRYQYLNGHQYSIGGSVNDPVNQPVFRIYDNGDLTSGTTMDQSVPNRKPGLLYYGKMGYLQIGSPGGVDTTKSPISYNGYEHTTGLILGTPGAIHGQLYNTIFADQSGIVDSGVSIYGSYITGNGVHFIGPNTSVGNSFISADTNSNIQGNVSMSYVNGSDLSMNGLGVDLIAGKALQEQVASMYSVAIGDSNQFGGNAQFTAGANLVNRTPNGTVLGHSNVDFSTLSYNPSTNAAYAGYPLFAIGNAGTSGRSNAITVLYNGRTQINTTGFTNSLTQAQVTPQAALDVVSTNTGVLLPRLTTVQRNAIASTDLQNGLLLYNTDSSLFQYYAGGGWTSVGSGTGGTSRWQFSGGTTYDSLDNIAIGTSNPQGYKLAVNGTAIFTKIVAKPQGSWPDYVFKRGYQLMSLPELEKYIAEHQHLPGLPSAEEIDKDGQDVGENQAVLLKKVEELTLYVIQLDKQVKALKKEHERLEKDTKH